GDHEIHILHEIYRDTEIQALLPTPLSEPPHPPHRAATRFVVSCQAVLEGEMGDENVLLLDVSRTGFRLFSKLPLRLQSNCRFKVQLGPEQTLQITAKPAWNRRQREWGFTLIHVPKAWHDFLTQLENQINRTAA